jgi:hypothetical protein
MKTANAAVPDTLKFHWTCPLCHWSGEVAVSTHFGNDHGRELHVGERLLDCPLEPRHLYFLEMFACPGCATERLWWFKPVGRGHRMKTCPR